MSKANVMMLRLPSDPKHRIEIVAKNQGVSINQLAMYMLSKEVSSFEAGDKISSFWRGYDKKAILNDFDKVMSKINSADLPDWDEIPRKVAESEVPKYE
jgi:hypothetical protein